LKRKLNELIKLPCQCTSRACPAYSHCCFLPTSCYVINNRIDLLFVGQGGGYDERLKGEPFIGDAGQRLRYIIKEVKKLLKRKFGVAFSNTIRDNPQGNRIPADAEVNYCIHHLKRDVKFLSENYGLRIVMPLGNHANQVITGSTVGITRDRGNIYQVNFGVPITVIPSLHPSYLIRNGHSKDNKLVEDIIKTLELTKSS